MPDVSSRSAAGGSIVANLALGLVDRLRVNMQIRAQNKVGDFASSVHFTNEKPLGNALVEGRDIVGIKFEWFKAARGLYQSVHF